MGLFKNKVGRPSNDTIKRRRIIYLVIILVAVLGIGAGVFYTVNYFKNRNTETIEGTDKNSNSDDARPYLSFRIKNTSGAIKVGSKKYKRGTEVEIEPGSTKTYDIELISGEIGSRIITATYLTFEMQFPSGIANYVKDGLSKYPWQVEIYITNKYGEKIKSTGRIDVKKQLISKTLYITSDASLLHLTIYTPRKGHDVYGSYAYDLTTFTEPFITKTFPDANLRKCVLEAYNDQFKSAKKDLSTSELAKITRLFCNYTELEKFPTNITGIEKLTGLTSLKLTSDKVTSIDLKKNTKLTDLYIYNQDLKTIDLKKNTKLINLNIDAYNLKTIDLSKNTKLETLKLNTHLKEINLKKNTKLTYLKLFYNYLGTIDLSKNTKLTYLDLNYNNLETIDLKKNTKLVYVSLRDNKLKSLDLSKNTMIAQLAIENNPIKEENIKLPKNLKLSWIQRSYVSNPF